MTFAHTRVGARGEATASGHPVAAGTVSPVLGQYRCVVCGVDFEKERQGGRPPSVCSQECKAEQARRRASDWYAANPERVKNYREINREKIAEGNRAYYATNPEAEKKRARRWQVANPDKVAVIKQREKYSGKPRARAAKFRAENPELFKQRQRDYYWSNPEVGRKRALQWAKDNPEKAARLNSRNNRRRKAVMRGASLTERFDAADIYERDAWICGLCGRPIDQTLKYPDRMSASLDHVVPISKGGQHTRANAQAAHYTCNSSKRDRLGISGDLPLA